MTIPLRLSLRVAALGLIITGACTAIARADLKLFDNCDKEPNVCRDACKANPGLCVQAWWKSQARFYLLIASSANDTFGHLEYVEKQDLPRMKQLLTNAGFDPVPGTSDLVGMNATTSRVEQALNAIPSQVSENTLVIVYFTGHGIKVDPPGLLSLKLAGTDKLDITTLLADARTDQTGRKFRGTLIVTIDSCDSGQAALTAQLRAEDAYKTWILVSSSSDQSSHEYAPPGADPVSAFTYVLTDGIENHWDQIDKDHSGFIKLSDLAQYIFATFPDLNPHVGDQEPHLQADAFSFLLFDPAKSTDPTDNLDKIYGRKALDSLPPLSGSDGVLSGGAVTLAATDEQKAAATLVSDTAKTPLLFRVAKAVIENRFDAARDLANEIPNEDLSNLLKARIELYAGSGEAALASYNKVSGAKNDPELSAEMGMAYLAEGDTANAIKSLQFADTKLPAETFGFSVKNWLASAYVRQNDIADAVAVYSQLTNSKNQTTKAVAFANIAELQDANMQVQDAAKSYKKSVAAFDRAGTATVWFKTTLRDYSRALRSLGRTGDAVKAEARIQGLSEEKGKS